jgi:hypothetical protein
VIDGHAPLQFLRLAYQPGEWIAVFVKSSEHARTAQRIAPVSVVMSSPFQAWLARENHAARDVFVSVNVIRPGKVSRQRRAIGAIRHVFLDADQDGPAVVAAIAARADLPPLSYVLHSSPNRVHVFWRVAGFTIEQVEALQKQLARELDTDSAATSGSQMTRLPGFLYLKSPVDETCVRPLPFQGAKYAAVTNSGKARRKRAPRFPPSPPSLLAPVYSLLHEGRIAHRDRLTAVGKLPHGRVFSVCESASCGKGENQSRGESTERDHQYERYARAWLRRGEQATEESRDCVERGVHGDRCNDAEAGQVGAVGQDEALPGQEEDVDPQRRIGPAGIQEEGQVPTSPEEPEDQGATHWSKSGFKPRERVSSPAWLFTEWAAEQCRIVVNREGRQDAPVEFSRIGGRDSWENHVGKDHQCHADGRGTESPWPGRIQAKSSVVARCHAMRDKRCDSGSKCGDGCPLQWRVKHHHRHEYQPCPRIGNREKDDQRGLWSH